MATASDHYDAATRARATECPDRTRLQRFHNTAKRALLNIFAKDAKSLLDLACGRGGDIHKWRALGIRDVLGLDISAESVEEGQARFETIATRSDFNYVFQTADLRTGWRSPERKQYDAVTCMFAMHYFFDTEASAHALLKTASDNLKPGGYFVGIVPDAFRVNEYIKFGPFNNGVMRVVANWNGAPQCFGSAYTCSIANTIVEESTVPEYLVYGSVLQKVAAMYGFEPEAIHHTAFQESIGMLHPLRPPYNGPEAQASELYAGFALRKKH